MEHGWSPSREGLPHKEINTVGISSSSKGSNGYKLFLGYLQSKHQIGPLMQKWVNLVACTFDETENVLDTLPKWAD